MFASMFPEDVSGVLLLDASPANWITVLCSVVDDGSDGAASYRDLCASLSDPANNPEHLDAPAAFTEVAEVTSLGDLPMIVDTAAEHPWGLAPSEQSRVNDEWTAGQDHWVSLSSAAQFQSVDNTGHYIAVDRPDVVPYRSLRCWTAGWTTSNQRSPHRPSRRLHDGTFASTRVPVVGRRSVKGIAERVAPRSRSRDAGRRAEALKQAPAALADRPHHDLGLNGGAEVGTTAEQQHRSPRLGEPTYPTGIGSSRRRAFGGGTWKRRRSRS